MWSRVHDGWGKKRAGRTGAPAELGQASTEDLGDCFWREVKVQFGSDCEQFGDADVAEFGSHAEVGDAESLDLAGAVLLDDPPVGAAEEIVEVRDGGAALGFAGVGGGHGLPRRDKARDDVREVGAFLAFERGPEGGALGGSDQGFQDGWCCVHGGNLFGEGGHRGPPLHHAGFDSSVSSRRRSVAMWAANRRAKSSDFRTR